MISLLIPAYNYDVRTLVQSLHAELAGMQIPFEIIVMEDGSEAPASTCNASLAALPRVRYVQLSANIGRYQIRQQLAALAQYEWLLFLDADALPLRVDFVQTYLQATPHQKVIVGGTVYSPLSPAAPQVLRWKAGHKKEMFSLLQRQAAPALHFSLFNVMLHREAWQALSFPAFFKGYGHEDTFIGLQLAQKNIPIHHIENPALHGNLDDAVTYLQKTKQALENLWRLCSYFPDQRLLQRQIRLYRCYRRLRAWQLLPALLLLYGIFEKDIERHLHSAAPQLLCFDLFKLAHFARLAKADHK